MKLSFVKNTREYPKVEYVDVTSRKDAIDFIATNDVSVASLINEKGEVIYKYSSVTKFKDFVKMASYSNAKNDGLSSGTIYQNGTWVSPKVDTWFFPEITEEEWIELGRPSIITSEKIEFSSRRR